jgi:hypothetical protein
MGKSDDDLADIQDAPTKPLLFVPLYGWTEITKQ